MTQPLRVDERLKEWATERQNEYLDAINLHGGIAPAARVLGVNKSVISRSIKNLKKRAAHQGYAPEHDMTRPVPDGFNVRGVSTYYDGDGNPRGQWVKSEADKAARLAIIREAIESLCDEIKPLGSIRQQKITEPRLLNLYTMTDCHMGMLAWHREGGADWDLRIATRVLGNAFRAMLDQSPPATVGFINQLGDWLHADSIMPLTPTSGHVLDTDGRFSKVVSATINLLASFVSEALEKHEKVIVLMAEGNHDLSSSIWLRAMFRKLFEDNPRVEVIDSPLPYYAYRHGETMLGFHHGHLKKNDALPLLFAAQFHDMWGATKKRYVHVGHRHHMDWKDHSGMRVCQHPTLAARDAYAARGGWISEREATAITYHDVHGQVGTVTVTPEMVE